MVFNEWPYWSRWPWQPDQAWRICAAGMAEMAEVLLQELRPYLIEARTTGQDVTFGEANSLCSP